MKSCKILIISAIIFCVSLPTSYSQISSDDLLGQYNAFTPAVPFLLFSPTAEIGGLANIQSVSGQSGFSGVFGNPGLLSGDSAKFGFVAAYMPWIRELIPDFNYYSLGGFYRISEKHVIGVNGVILQQGEINYLNIPGQTPGPFRPLELAPSISYSYSISKLMSFGVRAKYIYSDLVGRYVGGVESTPGQALAFDVGFSKNFINKNRRSSHQVGVTLQNVGSKISYSKNSDKNFIPINLRVGYRYNYRISYRSNIFVSYEIEKLLIPSPPIYFKDSLTISHAPAIEYGYDPNVSVPLGMIRSFYDAPDGLSEELHEIQHHIAIGLKLNRFRVSGGYFHQDATKGHNKYFSIGTGVDYRSLRLDMCYIIPVYKNSYLTSTFQLALGFIID